MVPHRQALRALALVAASRYDRSEYLLAEQERLKIRFPVSFEQFLDSAVYQCIPPALEAYLKTTDFSLVPDYWPLMDAARELGVRDFIGIGADGPILTFSEGLTALRTSNTIRIFIETCWLSGVSQEVILEDLRAMYGVSFNDADVRAFTALFADREYVDGAFWLNYERCVGEAEARYKRRMMRQPHEFIRWKLGAPVVPNADRILDRMIADGYFTERELKFDAGNSGLDLSKDQQARLKLERDTIFKAIDRKLKLKESGNGGDGAEAQKLLDKMLAKYDDGVVPLATEVVGETLPAPGTK